MLQNASAIPDARPSIFVVEDERVVALDLAGTLKDLGYRVAGMAARADDAIRRTSETKPNLILMDVRLAGETLDGIQIAEIIRRRQDVPVIYLTAHSDDETVRRAAQTDASGYLVKPFKSPELRCAIEIALHKHATDRVVREREHWLSLTLQSVAEAVIATDDEGCVQLFNSVAEVLTGWTEEEARLQPIQKLLSVVNETTGEPLDVVGQAIEARRTLERIDAALVSKVGERIPIEQRIAPIMDDHGNVRGTVLVLRDVSERKLQLEQIRKLNDDLERRVLMRTAELQAANRELEAFSYSVAHDLRAPLRSIAAFSQRLSTEHASQLDEEGQRYLERVRAAVSKMSELIDALLSLAGVGRRELRPATVNVYELAREVARDLSESHPAQGVKFTAEGDLVTTTDPSLLRMILCNLLDNAWKFTRGHPDPEVTFGTCRTLDLDTFYVRDNGAGFDPRYTGKLFEAFQRLHHESAFPGTGIGLAIVDRAIRRLGGNVWADSRPNEGATFYFTLPRMQS